MKDSYVVIQSFMVDELHLKGNELIVFAVIYGYTQDGEHWYYGTRGHLAEWCGATKGTVSNCLNSLADKGYIRRREVQRRGASEVQYQAVLEFCTTLPKIDTPPAKNCDTPLPKIDSINSKDGYSNDKPNNRFTPPTPEQVRGYAEQKGLDMDADAFCDYWESVGWVRGKTKMKDWKAAARQWARNDRKWRGGALNAELAGYAERLDF